MNPLYMISHLGQHCQGEADACFAVLVQVSISLEYAVGNAHIHILDGLVRLHRNLLISLSIRYQKLLGHDRYVCNLM